MESISERLDERTKEILFYPSGWKREFLNDCKPQKITMGYRADNPLSGIFDYLLPMEFLKSFSRCKTHSRNSLCIGNTTGLHAVG